MLEALPRRRVELLEGSATARSSRRTDALLELLLALPRERPSPAALIPERCATAPSRSRPASIPIGSAAANLYDAVFRGGLADLRARCPRR